MSENLINSNSKFEEILKEIVEQKFSTKYPSYDLLPCVSGYFISPKNKKKEIESFFLFEEKIKVKFTYKKPKKFSKEFEAFSSLEIEKYAMSNNIKISELFIFMGEKKLKYSEVKQSLGLFLDKKIFIINVLLIDKLPKLILKKPLKSEQDYKPEEYSPNFYDYFINEDKNEKETKLKYINNEIRNRIKLNIYNLILINNIKTYKFTGPALIGKSFTLFYLSRILYDIIYINLKILYKNKKNLYKCYHIIINELERIRIENKVDDLNTLIANCYEEQLPSLKLILTIMKFLFINFKERNFVFILDQYKDKYLIDEFNYKIKAYTNIKLVFCSSINDKKIRIECIKSWIENKKNITDFNEETQEFYFYYSNIYTYKQKKYNNELLAQFNYLPKYIKIYEDNNKNETKFLLDVKNRISKKIKEFCNNDDDKYYDILVHLRYILDKEYNINELSEAIKYCLLKFFKIIFKEVTFIIKPIFSFMNYFIRIQFSEDICFNYFKNNLYRKNTIENDSVKGCYFEEAVKYGLQKLNLPCKFDKIITLREITQMNELIDINSYYNIEEDRKSNENKMDIDFDAKNNIDKKSNDNNKIKFKELLENYNINYEFIKSKIINYNMLVSKNSLRFSKNIENFRLDEIENKKEDEIISIKDIYKGDESFLLDQVKKTGKALDYGFLYGKKENKAFIGFQIKCYFNNSTLNKDAIDKFIIREKCKKILVNSMILFNCKITKWYYILIFYLNDEVTEENINTNNLENCKNNKIHYLFYNPKKKKFYDNQKVEIFELKLDDFSDLDHYYINALSYTKIIDIIKEEGDIKIVGNLDSMVDSFVEDMDWITKAETNKFKIILEKLSNIFEYEFKFDAKLNIIEDGLLLPPNENHVYIYKTNNDYFILVQRNNNRNEFFNLKERKFIDSKDFFKLINDNKISYLYCLEKGKKIKKIK